MAWGWNSSGQCNVPEPNDDFIAAAGGGYHSLGLKSDGTIVAWGRNSDGQCNVPEPNTDFIAVAGGGIHSLGLKSDGTIVSWGSTTPVPEPNENFVAIAGGRNHNLGLQETFVVIDDMLSEYFKANLSISSVSPNPFNSHALVVFQSPELESLAMEVFDLSGRLVHRQDAGAVTQGQHTLFWDGSDLAGEHLTSGVYVIRLVGGMQVTISKIVLMK